MIYTGPNPFTYLSEGTMTELNSDTGEVWHIHRDGFRKKSEYDFATWVRKIERATGQSVEHWDSYYAMDEGL